MWEGVTTVADSQTLIKDKRCDMSIYQENGFMDRHEYLESLADDYGVSLDTVEHLADLLGSSEDFDGLITSIEDLEYWDL